MTDLVKEDLLRLQMVRRRPRSTATNSSARGKTSLTGSGRPRIQAVLELVRGVELEMDHVGLNDAEVRVPRVTRTSGQTKHRRMRPHSAVVDVDRWRHLRGDLKLRQRLRVNSSSVGLVRHSRASPRARKCTEIRHQCRTGGRDRGVSAEGH